MRGSAIFGGLLAAALAACSGAAGGTGRSAAAADSVGAGLREGRFERRVLLTAEVRAERGDLLFVPEMPTWQAPLRWLVEDGATVHAGDRVAEIDGSQVAGDVDQKRTALDQARAELRQAEADSQAKVERAEFELAQARGQLEQARIDAAIPRELLAGRAYADHQLARTRAEAAAGKAEAELARVRAQATESVGTKRLALEQRQRELSWVEKTLAAVVLRAPHDGIAVVQDIPWQGRKVQIGDSVGSGWPLVQLPDLDSLILVGTLFDVDDGAIHVGDPARCVADAHPGQELPCRVRSVAAVARQLGSQSMRRYFPVLLDFEDREAARRALLPGMSVRAEVIAETREHALLVSRADLVFESGAVRRRDPSGELRPLAIGPCNVTECVVEDGGGLPGPDSAGAQ